jgi:hypothetical protein
MRTHFPLRPVLEPIPASSRPDRLDELCLRIPEEGDGANRSERMLEKRPARFLSNDGAAGAGISKSRNADI